jgi:hypothetical protein
MNKEKIAIIFLIILGLVITIFLGNKYLKEGFTSSSTPNEPQSPSSSSSSSNVDIKSTNYDNYNHYNKTFYGPNGGMAIITTKSDGTQIIKITLSSNDKPIIFTPSKFSISGETFYGPNGGTATLVNNNGKKAIIVKNDNGVIIYKLQGHNQNDISSTQYFGSTGYTIYPFQANAYTDDKYNKSQAQQNQQLGLNTNQNMKTSPYSSVLPQGIPRSQIPPGQEDLYILKSAVIPPVCPACPTCSGLKGSSQQSQQGDSSTCPPCPPCARCPEPSFECKKVPNYNAINNQYLPAPIVNSFSTFGR